VCQGSKLPCCMVYMSAHGRYSSAVFCVITSKHGDAYPHKSYLYIPHATQFSSVCLVADYRGQSVATHTHTHSLSHSSSDPMTALEAWLCLCASLSAGLRPTAGLEIPVVDCGFIWRWNQIRCSLKRRRLFACCESRQKMLQRLAGCRDGVYFLSVLFYSFFSDVFIIGVGFNGQF